MSDPGFRDHLQTTVQAVRAALLDVVTGAGGDPAAPQELARRFDLDKSLTWKVSRVLLESDAESAAALLPGAAGLRIFLSAVAAAGAENAALEAARRAIADFERMVELHATDRATLDMLLTSLRSNEDPRRAELHRKQAYNGNSVIWGVQAKTRLATYFMAPNADDPERVDAAVLGGLVGIRRLRDDASWPLVRTQTYDGDGAPLVTLHEPIDPAGEITLADNARFPLLRAFSSDPPPDLRAVRVPGGVQFEIEPGPIGNAGVQTCLFGRVTIGSFPVHGDDRNTHGEAPTRLFTPTEWVLCDLFVHRLLPFTLPPEASLHGQLASWNPTAISATDPRLPLAETIQELGPAPHAATPLVPEYPRLLRTAFSARDWDPREFRGFRLQMRFPPIPSVLLLRFRLPILDDV